MQTRTKLAMTLTIILMVILFLVLLFPYRKKGLDKPHHDLEKIMKKGQLHVVTTTNLLGFNVDKSEKEGFNYEIIKKFADILGVELVISTTNNLDSAIQGIWDEEFDIIASLLPNTTNINEKLQLSQPFFTTRQLLVQQLENDSILDTTFITDQHMLAGEKIFISKASPIKMRIEHLSDEIAAPIEIVEVENTSTEMLVKEVNNKVIPLTICYEFEAERLKSLYSDIDISLPIGFEQEMCWATNTKSVKLAQKLDEFLSDFLVSTDYMEIYRRYYR